MVSQFSEFFAFDLFDLLILIPGVHCFIVLVCDLFMKTQISYAK